LVDFTFLFVSFVCGEPGNPGLFTNNIHVFGKSRSMTSLRCSYSQLYIFSFGWP